MLLGCSRSWGNGCAVLEELAAPAQAPGVVSCHQQDPDDVRRWGGGCLFVALLVCLFLFNAKVAEAHSEHPLLLKWLWDQYTRKI